MSYIFLLGQEEESSAESFSDIAPFVLSRLNLTAEKASCNGSETELCHGSQSGMTCEPLTATPGEASLTSSAADSPVKTSVPPVKAPASPESDLASGWKWHGSFAKYDHATRSWKTPQCLLDGDLEEFSETWPRWGSMRDGESFRERTPLGLLEVRQSIMNGSESGFSAKEPTPTKSMVTIADMQQAKFAGNSGKRPTYQEAKKIGTPTSSNKIRSSEFAEGRVPTPREAAEKLPTPHGFSKDGKSNGPSGNELGRAVNRRIPTPDASMGTGGRVSKERPTGKRSDGTKRSITINDAVKWAGEAPLGGSLNPDWVEWLMGWPIGWTALRPLEMGKFRKWPHSHGES